MEIEKFRASNFERRTAWVKVPSLSYFFKDGEEPKIQVQNLTGEELFQAQARIEANRMSEELIRRLSVASAKTKVDAIVEAFGLNTKKVADKLVQAIAYVEMGAVSVDLSQEDCVKMARVKPVALLDLFYKIQDLSGEGFVSQGELNATGTTPESETP